MKPSFFDLHGKVALVTGGATGIGLAIAHGFANAGATVVICGRRASRCEAASVELVAHGVPILALPCDVSNPDEVTTMMTEAVRRFGRIDILVNNAGIAGAAKSLLDMDLSDWRRTLDINLTGMMLCSQAATRHMVRQGGGKIINVASVGAFKPLPHSADYCASKAGVLLLTRTMALELIKYRINVNAICPGYFRTELVPETIAKAEKEAAAKIPAGSMGEAHQLQGVALLLASDASDYMVGSAIVVDGGVMLK